MTIIIVGEIFKVARIERLRHFKTYCIVLREMSVGRANAIGQRLGEVVVRCRVEGHTRIAVLIEERCPCGNSELRV